MRSQADLIRLFSGRLESAGIGYMLVGSLASSFHGEPRSTRDIDIVIDPSAESLNRFLREVMLDDFYVDGASASEALASRTQFNIIDPSSGWKIDLIIRKDRPFSRQELGRRLAVRVLDVDTHVATAEDTIVAKLEWARSGESEQQLRDVVSILAASRDALDRTYLATWITALGLEQLWERAQQLAGR